LGFYRHKSQLLIISLIYYLKELIEAGILRRPWAVLMYSQKLGMRSRSCQDLPIHGLLLRPDFLLGEYNSMELLIRLNLLLLNSCYFLIYDRLMSFLAELNRISPTLELIHKLPRRLKSGSLVPALWGGSTSWILQLLVLFHIIVKL
jgi:hypothetical protein